MQLYLISPVFGAILLLCMLGGPRRVLLLVAAAMPFGMLAVISLPSVGGLSLLAVNLTAAVLVGMSGLIATARLARGQAVTIDGASLALGVFAAYAVFSATVLVRLFAGSTMVFSLSRDDTGAKVSALFSWGKVWLGPSSSNISQTFYVVLSFGLFVAISGVLARYGAALGVRCMVIAACVNLTLGALDLAALDPILAVVRTANYSLANEASVSGFARVIGGYSEAASFGMASALFFGYFASAYLQTWRGRDGLLALGNGAFAGLALSTTGIIALGVVFCLLTLRAAVRVPTRVSPAQVFTIGAVLGGVALVVSGILLLTPAADTIESVVSHLIVDKSQSSSGLERTAWAMGGLDAFVDTWGLGVGTGSLRSNGLLFVLLGSVGFVGTTAFVIFLWLAFGGRAAPGQEATLSNARIAASATLVSMALAATVPDPGVPLIFLAAIAVSAKRRQPDTIEQRQWSQVART